MAQESFLTLTNPFKVNEITLFSVVSLGAIGAISAIILFLVAQKFKVIEDPRIDIVADKLPGANCGGCGYAGCRALAEAIVKAESLDGLSCPPGGNAVLADIAAVLGLEASEQEPMIAVLRCNGSRENSPPKVKYDGAMTCSFAHSLFSGEGGCPYGCLGCGDCVEACQFDAMYMDPVTGLPVILDDKCVACGACVKACPRNIIEMRKKGKKDRRIFVSCVNKEKGGVARKNCEVACIGCGKCVKECKFEAITMVDNLAYIDFNKCTLCRKCVPVCPTNAIHELNFPPRKPKVEDEVAKSKG
ncbi:MAG: Fe-S cluster domain-containing protein [Bacteroidales bacterium]|nr:Fe-S cluster domain-containing protein [Bacteroidales bacterium]